MIEKEVEESDNENSFNSDRVKRKLGLAVNKQDRLDLTKNQAQEIKSGELYQDLNKENQAKLWLVQQRAAPGQFLYPGSTEERESIKLLMDSFNMFAQTVEDMNSFKQLLLHNKNEEEEGEYGYFIAGPQVMAYVAELNDSFNRRISQKGESLKHFNEDYPQAVENMKASIQSPSDYAKLQIKRQEKRRDLLRKYELENVWDDIVSLHAIMQGKPECCADHRDRNVDPDSQLPQYYKEIVNEQGEPIENALYLKSSPPCSSTCEDAHQVSEEWNKALQAADESLYRYFRDRAKDEHEKIKERSKQVDPTETSNKRTMASPETALPKAIKELNDNFDLKLELGQFGQNPKMGGLVALVGDEKNEDRIETVMQAGQDAFGFIYASKELNEVDGKQIQFSYSHLPENEEDLISLVKHAIICGYGETHEESGNPLPNLKQHRAELEKEVPEYEITVRNTDSGDGMAGPQ